MHPEPENFPPRHARLFELIRQEAVLCERRASAQPARASDVVSARDFLTAAMSSLQARND